MDAGGDFDNIARLRHDELLLKRFFEAEFGQGGLVGCTTGYD